MQSNGLYVPAPPDVVHEREHCLLPNRVRFEPWGREQRRECGMRAEELLYRRFDAFGAIWN